MGIQSWKGQRRTGNTIRASAKNTKQGGGSEIIKRRLIPDAPAWNVEAAEQEQYQKKTRRRGRRRSKALHEDKKHSEFEEAEELEGLEAGIIYSLNKKGRWNIPEMMINEIHEIKKDNKVDTKDKSRRSKQSDTDGHEPDMTIYKLHTWNRRHRCIEFCSTKLPGDGSVHKSKSYINSDSFLRKNWNRTIWKRRRPDASGQQKETVNNLGTTEVEVSYPHPQKICLGGKRSERCISEKKKRPPDTSINGLDCFDFDAISDAEDDNYDENDIEANTNLKLKERNIVGKVAGKKIADSGEEYEWFLAVNVQMPARYFCSEDSSEKNDERFGEIETDLSLEDDWVFTDYEETQEKADVGILGNLISEAFARKVSTANGSQTTSSKRRRYRTVQRPRTIN